MHEPDTIASADGIIVLTGGHARLKTAINLLKQQRGKRLLISGVHAMTGREELRRITHTDSALFDCCIDIDHTARDTIGNALESAKWIKANHYYRIIVVTNNYHMPRSIVELSRIMSNVIFIPYPVVNVDLRQDNWIRKGDTVRLLLTEYIKYLGSVTRHMIP